jgi:hypothetical protein
MPIVIANPSILPTPLGLWALDETAGTIAANSGSGADGSYVNTPTLGVTGLKSSGTAVSFNGVDEYIETSITMTHPNFALMCWISTASAPVGTGEFNGPMYGGFRGIAWDHTDPSFRGAGFVRVASTFYSATFGTLLGATTYHLALTYDGSALRTYKNGSIVTTNSSMSGNADADVVTLQPMRKSTDYMLGTLDEPRYYTESLSGAAILSIYNAGI